MTIDERIEALTRHQEQHSIALQQDGEHIRQLAAIVRETAESIGRLEVQQEKTQVMLAEMADSIRRLERVTVNNSLGIDDIERRLTELEGRRQKKPQ